MIPHVRKPPEFVCMLQEPLVSEVFLVRTTLEKFTGEAEIKPKTWHEFGEYVLFYQHRLSERSLKRNGRYSAIVSNEMHSNIYVQYVVTFDSYVSNDSNLKENNSQLLFYKYLHLCFLSIQKLYITMSLSILLLYAVVRKYMLLVFNTVTL